MDFKYPLVKLYHDSHSLVRHHLDSFNHFIDVDMKKIVKTHGKIKFSEYKFSVEFENINVEMPTIADGSRSRLLVSPKQCRLRNLTYASDITVDIKVSHNNTLNKKTNVIIGRIPIMLRSNRCNLYGKSHEQLIELGECLNDTGGYFITKGTERVFLMQEQMAKNRMIIEKQKITKKGGIKVLAANKLPDLDIVCNVVSFTVENKSKTTVFRNSGYFYVNNSLFTESIPLFVLFAALNMPAHKDIFESVGLEYEIHNELILSCHEAINLKIFSQKQALMWLIPKIKIAANRDNKMTTTPGSIEEELRSLHSAAEELNRRVLNHVPGNPENFSYRVKYLGLMVRRILLAENDLLEPDDRDFYGIKRIELVGSYLSLAFEDRFQTCMDDLRKTLYKTLSAKTATALEAHNMIKEYHITEGMFLCIFTGNWNFQRFAMARSGVTQVLNRLSYIATLGHLARISSQFEKVRKISGARSIHLSQTGFVCPVDTPEGEACGLVKNLAFMVEITMDQDTDELEKQIRRRYGGDLGTFQHNSNMSVLMLNGVPIGWTDRHEELGQELRKLRRMGRIHEHVSIYYEREVCTLHICSDSGRMVRPYVVVKNGKSLLTIEVQRDIEAGHLSWNDLVKSGIIEYIDAKEGYSGCLMANSVAEIRAEHTHVDIDPSTKLGSVASLIPFPHNNQSPRNTYQCAMGKQAIGVVASNQRVRCDGTSHVLVNPQRPLTLSNVGTLIQYDQLPAGQNAIVAITTFGGHDIEDALIVNKASLERGMLRSLTNKYYYDVLKDNDNLGVPTHKGSKHHALEEDGTARISEFIENGDVLIHKLSTPYKDPYSSTLATVVGTDKTTETPAEPPGPKPCTTVYHGSERTQCTNVMITHEEHGYTLVGVRTSQNRQPEVGDKLSSRHGQKGVIGRVVPQVEMPYSESGLVPDIIMNPHGFPSRMTVGKLIELLANKCAVLDGKIRDSSAFCKPGHYAPDKDSTAHGDYQTVLRQYGFSVSGKEVFYSGINGQVMEADIYIGPVFYQRLKHMVQDKVHARSTGKVQQLTRQPVVGRAQDGGLRVGEMERDCLIAYGATQILKERMMLSSDSFRCWVCEQCGLLATSKDWCQMCRSSQHVSSTKIPYAAKLLLQELMTMQIRPRLTLSRDETAVL